MGKQQSLHRVKMYDSSTYRSVEQKVMGALEPVGKELVDFGGTLIKSLYGTVFAPLRFPTFIRRCANEQALMSKLDREVTPSNGSGFAVGFVGGFVADMAGLYYVLAQAIEGNYIPAIALGATNLASGIFELGRRDKSRREYLGLQEYKKWQQKKREEKEEKEAKKKKTKSGGFVE